MTPKFNKKNDDGNDTEDLKSLHSILNILPTLNCLTPVETLNLLNSTDEIREDICPMMFDSKILNSAIIQRSCHYLNADATNQNLDSTRYTRNHNLNVNVCLSLLLKHLEHTSPSWSEIIHFASFLNSQLVDCENSIFCDTTLTGDLLPGFKNFVIKFMIQMSHDFALPSLQIRYNYLK